MKTRIIFVWLCLIAWANYAQAQETFTTADSVFFAAQQGNIKTWLQQVGITDTQVTAIRLQTVPTYMVLRLYADSTRTDTWERIAAGYALANPQSNGIAQDLVNAVAAYCEINPLQVLLYVHTGRHTVKAGFNKGNFEVESEKSKIMTQRPFTLMKRKNEGTNSLKANTIEGARDLLSNAIEAHYKDKKILYGLKHAEIQKQLIGNSQVVFRITNLKGEIVKGASAAVNTYEMLTITVCLKQTDKIIQANISVDAKYGAGIVEKPRNNAYIGISEQYREELENYTSLLVSAIYQRIRTNTK